MPSPLNDSELSATSRLIWNEYADSGLDRPWNREQVNRLAAALGVTIQELGAACCVDWKTMKEWYLANEFPPHVCLNFAKLVTLWREHRFNHAPQVQPDDVVWARIITAKKEETNAA